MKKILLVDDKVTIGRVLKIYLGTEYDLEYFEDPLKALEWLNEGNLPDLIISDIRMPHMRGNEFLYYLKGNELLKHIPVVMLSSEESTTERIHLLYSQAIQSFGAESPHQEIHLKRAVRGTCYIIFT